MKENENKKTAEELMQDLREKTINKVSHFIEVYKDKAEAVVEFVNSSEFSKIQERNFNIPKVTTSLINLNDENDIKKLPDGEKIAQIIHEFVETTTKTLYSINSLSGYILFFESTLIDGAAYLFDKLSSYPADVNDFEYKCQKLALGGGAESTSEDSDDDTETKEKAEA